MNKHKNVISLKYLIITIVVTALVSGLTSGVIVYSSYSKSTGISYKEITDDESLKEFLEVYSSLDKEYYEDIDKNALIDAAISAMLNYLDDSYTSFLDSKETDSLNELLVGEYKGIGVLISDHTITSVFAKSPAESAGLQVGDEITEVNGSNVSDISSSDLANLIKNSSSSSVDIKVKRNGEFTNLKIELSTLYVPAIDYKVIDNTNIGYLSIGTFSSSLTNQVEDAVNELDKNNISSLIIDLRGNAGGYLSAAEGVANIFLEKGKTIYSLQNKKNIKTFRDNTAQSKNYKIVVLIDESSASAAEILTAALKESYGATVVGKTSYGKGKVQQTVSLIDGSMAKYTSAKWLTPYGNCIDEVGIKPDFDVDIKYVTDKKNNIVGIEDTQLNKAIELLSN